MKERTVDCPCAMLQSMSRLMGRTIRTRGDPARSIACKKVRLANMPSGAGNRGKPGRTWKHNQIKCVGHTRDLKRR